MTYGWAILVVLVVIGALAYFGVLSPKKLLPDKCLFGPGIGSCTDFQALADDGNGKSVVILKLTNGLGETISIDGATSTASGPACGTGTVLGVAGLAPGAVGTVTITCTKTLIVGDKTNIAVDLNYKKGATYVGSSGLAHIVSGSVSVGVQ